MKKTVLKTLTLIVAIGVAAPMLAAAADAPEGKRGKGAPGRRFDEALSKLDLTADQKPKVDAAKSKLTEYWKAHAEELKAAREETDPEKKRAAFKGVTEKMMEVREEIRSVLTDEQKKKFDELLPARMGEGKGKGQRKGGDKE